MRRALSPAVAAAGLLTCLALPPGAAAKAKPASITINAHTKLDHATVVEAPPAGRSAGDEVIFTETLFGWNGMGRYLIESIQSHDVNAVAAVACFTAVLVLLSGLLSDILYAALDPRVRAK